MTQNRFNYQTRPAEAWDKRAQQKGGTFAGFALDGFQVFGPKKGDNWIRILPPTWPNPTHYGLDLWVHYAVGPDNATVVCLDKMRPIAPAELKTQQCPICMAHAAAEAAGREDADDFKPTRRVLIWLINRAEEQAKPSEYIPQLWAMPWTGDKDLTKICKDRQTGELYLIDHPDSGYDVNFDRDESGSIPKYVGWQIARRPSAVAQRHLDYIVEHPLPTVISWRTAQEVQDLFTGGMPEAAPQAVPQFQTPVASVASVPAAVPPLAAPSAAVAPPPVVMAPPPPPPVAAAPPFQAHWTNTPCAQCGGPTYEYEPNKLVCQQQHVQEALPFIPAPPPVPVAPVPPPAPVSSPTFNAPSAVQTAPPTTGAPSVAPGPPADMFAPRPVAAEVPGPAPAQQPAVTGRAAALKQRFQTGKA